MAIQRTKFLFDTEKQLVTNLITNDEYCRTILPLIDEEFISSKSILTIIRWIDNYFESYQHAPKKGIIDIFDNESALLKLEEREHIEKILQHLSDTSYESDGDNTPYLIDEGKKFLRKRHFELKIKAAQSHLSRGELNEAEQVLEERFDIKDELDISQSWYDVDYTQNVIAKMTQREDIDNAFFRYPGRLGKFIGNLDPGWFVGIVGPSKRGKTIYLMETAHIAMHRRMNTLVYSLEMPIDQLFMRSMKSFTGASIAENDYENLIPVFDCELNQKNECNKECRVGFGSCFNNGALMEYDDNPEWEICTVCRGTRDFYPAAWRKPITRKAYSEDSYFKRVRAFTRLYGKYVRAIFHPSRTASVETLDSDLYYLQHKHAWTPQVVVLDYADLLTPSRNSSQKRFELDDIWEGLRSIAQQKHILLVTASQTNRGGVDSKYVRETDIAEDYSKIAKLDLGIGLCQTEDMKKQGMMNINKVISRHTEFIQSEVCTCLQELSLLQGILDTEYRGK